MIRQQSFCESPGPTAKFNHPRGFLEAPVPDQFSQGDILIKPLLILLVAETIIICGGLFPREPTRISHTPYLVPMLRGTFIRTLP